MNIFLTVVALLIVGVGIFVNRSGLINTPENLAPETRPEVLSAEEEQVEENETDGDVEKTPKPTPTLVKSAPTDVPASSPSETNSYQYPNSQVINSSGNSLSLVTTDNVDVVTSWYKDKISSEGMNVKSFVTTKANDNVVNKLVVASGEREIRVVIKKNSGESEVYITVSIL